MKIFQIRGKRLHRVSEDEYIFLTSGYGGRFFSFPRESVFSVAKTKKPINEVTEEDWYEFTVSEKMWIKRVAYRHYDEIMVKRGEMVVIKNES